MAKQKRARGLIYSEQYLVFTLPFYVTTDSVSTVVCSSQVKLELTIWDYFRILVNFIRLFRLKPFVSSNNNTLNLRMHISAPGYASDGAICFEIWTLSR